MRRILLKAEEVTFRAEVHTAVFIMVAVIIVAFGQVFGRYVLDYAPAWFEELARYLFVWVVFIGAPIGVRERGHMAIMLVVDHLAPARRQVCSLLIYAVSAIFLLILAWQGISIMIQTGSQVSPTMEISMVWVYAAIPVGSILMLFHLAISFLKMGLSENPLFSFKG